MKDTPLFPVKLHSDWQTHESGRVHRHHGDGAGNTEFAKTVEIAEPELTVEIPKAELLELRDCKNGLFGARETIKRLKAELEEAYTQMEKDQDHRVVLYIQALIDIRDRVKEIVP